MEVAPIWINLMPEICWWYLFQKKMKRSFSTTLNIFKPLLESSIFKCISWLNGSFFGGEHRGMGRGQTTVNSRVATQSNVAADSLSRGVGGRMARQSPLCSANEVEVAVVSYPFWKRESRPIKWRQCRLSTRQLIFCLHIFSPWFL